jgi:uncharacterized protein (TIGR03435 family)
MTIQRRKKPTEVIIVGIMALSLLFVRGRPVNAFQAENSTSSQTLQGRSGLPQWEKDAGGKTAFDVTSVRQNLSGYPPVGQRPHSNFPLDSGDAYFSNGGLFDATNWPVYVYIGFAFRLTTSQDESIIAQLPKWAGTDHFDIQGRAAGNPTKDQMRLMMQSLLADRFKLAVHFKTQQGPIFDLVQADAGHLGARIKPHSETLPCKTLSTEPPGPTLKSGEAAGGIPFCGLLTGKSVEGHMEEETRGMSMRDFAAYIVGLANLDRPVEDETGLAGTFDLSIEYAPHPHAQQSDTQSAPPVAIFTQALQEQLGLKLIPATGPIESLVIDNIEEPSQN